MALETTTTSNKVKTRAVSTDGYDVGQSATDYVGFYGATPVVQPTATAQSVVVTVTDGSVGTAAATNGILPLTGTYNSSLIVNSIATLAALGNANAVLVNRLRTDLIALGLIKGS